MNIGRCSQPHYGEIVSLIAAPTTPTIDTDSGGTTTSINDKNLDACYQAAYRFLGLTTADNRASSVYGYWSIGLVASIVPMKPTVRQRAAGDHWLACAVYMTDQSNYKATALVQYQGSLRGAVSTGVGRNYLGTCPAEADWNQMTSSSCLQPHHGEIFANGTLPVSVTRDTLTASCAKLVSQITKRTGLHIDAHLTVDVQATDMNGTTLNGSTIPVNADVHCGVLTTGGRLLKGSLIFIGSTPIPWA